MLIMHGVPVEARFCEAWISGSFQSYTARSLELPSVSTTLTQSRQLRAMSFERRAEGNSCILVSRPARTSYSGTFLARIPTTKLAANRSVTVFHEYVLSGARQRSPGLEVSAIRRRPRYPDAGSNWRDSYPLRGLNIAS